MEQHDEAFETLRKADPTTRSLDVDDIWQGIERPSHEHAARSPWHRQAAIAAVIALAVGTGTGYQVAASRSTTESTVAATDALGYGAMSAAASSGAGTEAAAGGMQADSKMAAFGGRPFLTPADSLDDTAGSAAGYVISNDTVNTKKKIMAISAAFNISGSPVSQGDGSYSIGDTTGQAASASIAGTTDATASWWFSDPANSPWGCVTPMAIDSNVGGTDPMPSASGAPAPDTAPSCQPVTGKAMSKGKAIAAAQKIFAILGLKESEANWSVADTSWFGTGPDSKPLPFRHVTATLIVDGLDSGMEWTMDLGPDGQVSSANGFFGEFTATANYDTVGAKTATLRSQDPRWSSFGPNEKGGGYPIAYAKTTGTTPGGSTDSQGRPLLVSNLDEATITKATPSLSQYYLADGRIALLPSYDLTDGTRTWVQISIADSYITTAQ